MIPLPSAPTDNLYKFLFISGVLLCIFSIYQYKVALDESDVFIAKIEIETDKFINSSKPFEQKADSIEEQNRVWQLKQDEFEPKVHATNDSLMQMPKKKRDSLLAFNDSVIKYSNLAAKGSRMVVEVDSENVRQMKRRKDDYDIAIQLLDRQHEMTGHSKQLYYYLLYVLGTLGLSLSIVGGVLWYRKTQKPQDRILELQMMQIEASLPKVKFTGRKHFESKLFPRKKPITGRSL